MSSHPTKTVQIDGLVVMKIIRHMQENSPSLLNYGQLLGLSMGETLEVTHCFPLLALSDEGDEEKSPDQCSKEMMMNLRSVNVDSNSVGWYMIGDFGFQMNDTCIKAQYNYQTKLSFSIILMFDPVYTLQETLGLRALRLSDKFLKLYSMQSFKKENITEQNFGFTEIYEELPIKITNSVLVRAMLLEFDMKRYFPLTFSSLMIPDSSQLENDLSSIVDGISGLQFEQYKYLMAQRLATRQLANQQMFLTKRKAENTQRRNMDQPLLPETSAELELEAPSIFKATLEPSKFDLLLIQNQINNCCEQIVNSETKNLTKAFMIKAFKEQVDGKP